MRPPEFWNNRDGRESARMIRALLTPLAWLYAAAGARLYANGKPYRAKAKVICVGNLSLGGVGKTPVVMSVLARLRAKGVKAAALTRGYGGSARGPALVEAEDGAGKVGDEALLLARHAPVIVARKRAEGAKLADALGFDVLVMDDGFQNPSLQKDLSIVTVDGAIGFGNRCVVPAGPLREPIARGLKRADAVLLMRASPEAIRDVPDGMEGWRGPILNAWLEPDAQAAARLKGRRVVVFAGVGRPQKVIATFERIGAEVVTSAAFPDHYVYTPRDLRELRALAKHHDAALATTEKDFVRLEPHDRGDILVLPVWAAFAVEPALDELLAPVIASTRRTQDTVSA